MTRRISELVTALAVTGCLLGTAGALAGCASKSHSGGSASGTTSSTASTGNPGTVTFNDVTVAGATSMSDKPKVTAASSSQPSALQIKDLVTGTGTAATPTSTVTVQYVGVRYADGKQFDASWDHGGATSFPLTGVVPGFSQGIGGTSGVPAMKVGGRRLMILPAALGYGANGTPDGSIPPNAPIVFVVDLVGVN
ncbi:MAG TPA: FKBP-type peptidyl-prolyl cis-trans isomerase [Jatrophihabitans sp.]|nr:FKBP-type peptidyl-prolyl cis-trans isomerase [Jatrophihabitans sp.]